MSIARFFLFSLLILFLLPGSGCVTTDGGSTGWVVLDSPSGPSSSSPSASQGPSHPGKAQGLQVAARNHLRNAYRFLENGKPDHAVKQLEKARGKMDRDFWFHYYLGGAFYLKGRYGDARDSWKRAYRFTRNPRLRSRIQTCLSFSAYKIEGHDSSVGFLRSALDLDRENRTARDIFNDMIASNVQSQDGNPGFRKKPEKPVKMKSPGKSGGKGKKIEDMERFTGYFLVEMPQE